jgi:hypothetical protein
MPASTRTIGGAVAVVMLLATLVFSCGNDVVSIRHGNKAGTRRVAALFSFAAAGLAATALMPRRRRRVPSAGPRSPRTARCALALLLAAGACEAPGATIESMEISADQLPSEFDSTRTFHLTTGPVADPLPIVRDLLDAQIDVRRAWQPLVDNCLDPLGPRFTVEIEADDPLVLAFGFTRGEGRLRCATRLTAYIVVSRE